MRTSGGRGADAWMLGVPVIALLVAGAMSAGGFDSMLVQLDSVIRHTFSAGLNFFAKLL